MRARHLAWSACAFSLVLFAACSGDDDGGDSDKDKDKDTDTGSGGGSEAIDTGLQSSDKLSSLGDDDAVQACVSTAEAFNGILSQAKLKEIGCALAGISVIVNEKMGDVGAGDVAECEQFVDDCVAGKVRDENGEPFTIKTQIVDAKSCSTANAGETFKDCDATVADYESCAGRVATELRKRFSSISCDSLKDFDKFQESTQGTIDVSKSAECKTLRETCPNIDLSGSS